MRDGGDGDDDDDDDDDGDAAGDGHGWLLWTEQDDGRWGALGVGVGHWRSRI